jgi:anthraniloyl-CoA monooxygenase
MSASGSPVFQPFTMRGLTVPNRVVVSPMCQYTAIDGMPDDWHLVHLGSRAVGGAGLIIAEASGVSPIGRISPGCAGIYLDDHVPAWRRITDFVHARTGSKIGIQLGHAGRKAATKRMWEGHNEPVERDGWPIIGPTAEPYDKPHQVPRAMDRAMIAEVVAQFAAATRRTVDAGFDMIELHFAHGYLLSSFMSPISNTRNDEYGGELANRMRFPLEVVAAVRDAAPDDFPVGVRISASDYVEGGNDEDDAVEISRMLKDAGIDYITVSGGGIAGWSPAPRPGPLGYVPTASRIRRETGIATMAVGNINSLDEVSGILERGDADLVALARGHLRDPYFALHAAQQAETPDVAWPNQYIAVPRQDALWRKDRNAAG